MNSKQLIYDIADRIQFELQMKCISPEQFAHDVGITIEQAVALRDGSFSDIELLEDVFSLERIVCISNALSVSVEFLLTNRWIAAFAVDKDSSGFDYYYNDPNNMDERQVYDRLFGFDEQGFFDDMLFAPTSITGKFMTITSFDNNKKPILSNMERPEELEHFTFAWIKVIVSDIPGHGGCFNEKDQELTIPKESINDDKVLLHEMIHIYEYVIDSLPKYYHDVLFWALYSSLSKKIGGLDEGITEHAHLLNMMDITNKGGTHDILFFLKSLDLDMRMGYPFGTIFSYGKENELTYLKVIE